MKNEENIQPLPYQTDYEQLEEDEEKTISELKLLFVDMANTVAQKEKHAFRAVHAKGQGLLKGKLIVSNNLPTYFAQGLFSKPEIYDVIIRLSSPPAEQLSDNVSTPRAIALKVLNVQAPHVMESTEATTQDFLMVNGPAFVQPGPKGFLRNAKLLAATTEKMPKTKEIISSALRGVETVLEKLHLESASIKNLSGQPQTHPLSESYFSEVPFMYGPYMAKFSLKPHSTNLIALKEHKLDSHETDAQRDAINEFFGHDKASAEWEFQVQLCTDIEKMPIEDASIEWPTSLSPYVTVAKLIIQSQIAWDYLKSLPEEDQLSFSPWHALNEHRPLGAVNRARKVVMAASRDFRASFNKCPMHEPTDS